MLFSLFVPTSLSLSMYYSRLWRQWQLLVINVEIKELTIGTLSSFHHRHWLLLLRWERGSVLSIHEASRKQSLVKCLILANSSAFVKVEYWWLVRAFVVNLPTRKHDYFAEQLIFQNSTDRGFRIKGFYFTKLHHYTKPFNLNDSKCSLRLI